MGAVQWRRQALSDLVRIGKRIAQDSPINAEHLLTRISSKVDLLSAHPYLGHAGEREGTRELVVHPHYVAIYRLTADGIEALQVKHTTQQRR